METQKPFQGFFIDMTEKINITGERVTNLSGGMTNMTGGYDKYVVNKGDTDDIQKYNLIK